MDCRIKSGNDDQSERNACSCKQDGRDKPGYDGNEGTAFPLSHGQRTILEPIADDIDLFTSIDPR
jgi:hypothetical protein